jgi:hypothetical protein
LSISASVLHSTTTRPSFGVAEYDYIHEVLGRVPPRTGSQVLIRRPALDTGWVLTFALTVVNGKLTETMP